MCGTEQRCVGVRKLTPTYVCYNRQRQAAIDEELFDLIAGYEALRAEVAP